MYLQILLPHLAQMLISSFLKPQRLHLTKLSPSQAEAFLMSGHLDQTSFFEGGISE